jgi:curli biogenesis system outer membrane secretion channel CsgG
MLLLPNSRINLREGLVMSTQAASWLALAIKASIVLIAISFASCATTPYEAPHADSAPTTQVLKKLPRKQGQRVAVTIYEFRSSLPNVSSHTATDMFQTALVQSGQFRVVERARLNEGVVREKQLQQGGYAKGKAAHAQLHGAQYIFEGSLSEANASENQRSGGIAIAGMQIGGGANRDSIAIDVRIVDAASGDILDAITVRKSIKADNASVSGLSNLLGTVMSQKGRSSTYTPDVNLQQERHEGVDAAVRETINQAVIELSQRFAQ